MANSNRSNNPGNFANDRDRASEAGQKGGQASGGNHRSDSNQSMNAGSRSSGNSSNSGNFANDRDRASEAGRKGGQNSHSGRNSDDY